MPFYKALGPFVFKFKKSEQAIYAGEIVGLPIDIGNAAKDSGAVVEITPEEAAAAPKPSEFNFNKADSVPTWSRKRKKELEHGPE